MQNYITKMCSIFRLSSDSHIYIFLSCILTHVLFLLTVFPSPCLAAPLVIRMESCVLYKCPGANNQVNFVQTCH